MAEIQWIKLIVGMFDGNSFKRIKRARIGGERYRDKLTAIWFELLELAGRCNQGGRFISPRGIPYSTIEDIAVQIDREADELDLCMTFFINDGMIEIVNGIYGLTNWDEHQNETALEVIREQNRERKRKQRERQKQALLEDVSRDCHVTVTEDKRECHAIEEERDKDKEKESHSFTPRVSEEEMSDPDKRRKYLGGIGKGVVMLSDEQMCDLLDKLSLDEFNYYVEVVADCILKGKKYTKKTHYKAILEMAMADRKKG